jgi:hypothetical protein
MSMKRQWIIGSLAVLAFAIWLYFWCEPEKQVRRAQARLLAAMESGDVDSFAQLLAADYRDGWGHDKTFVVNGSRQVFSDFKTLDIAREEVGLELTGTGQWTLREKLTLSGLGGPVAMAVRERASHLHQPFTMVWRKSGWKPWNWELTSIAQPEIGASEFEMSW